MRVLVLGATGGTGKAIVEGCLAAGHDVRALVRRPEALALTSDKLEIVKGNALDTIAVGDAVRGMDAVISSLGSRPWRSDDVCSKGTAVLIGAMTIQHVSRLIAISSVGVTATLPYADFMTRTARATILRGILTDKDRMESLVMASRLEWVLVRPVILTNGAATAKFRVADDTSIPGGSVTRADVAAFCVGELDKREWTRKSPSIVGE